MHQVAGNASERAKPARATFAQARDRRSFALVTLGSVGRFALGIIVGQPQRRLQCEVSLDPQRSRLF
jgi:hypothetical protein